MIYSWEENEERKTLNAKARKALPDSAFAYIDKDGDRHLPIHDAAHVKAAMARFNQTEFDSDAEKKAAAKKVLAAAKSFDIEVDDSSDVAMAAGIKAKKDRSRKPRQVRGLQIAPEIRMFSADGLEMRDGSQKHLVEITGAPIVYNRGYSVLDMYGEFEERMHPGAATDVLTNDTRFLFNHDGMPMARTTSGTLQLMDTDAALRFKAEVDTRQSLTRDLLIAIERRDVTQMSVGFVVGYDEWSDDYEHRDIFRLKRLDDVSAVTYPASETTSIEIAQRMLFGQPEESRARLRKLYNVAVDLREGKRVSQADAESLSNALLALNTAGDTINSAHKEVKSHIINAMGDAYQGDPDNSQHGMSGDPAARQDGSGSRSATRSKETEDDYKPQPYDSDDEGAGEPVTCPNCGKGDAADAIYCDQCGFKLAGADGVIVNRSLRSDPGTKELRMSASFNDIQQNVQTALVQKFGDSDGDCDLWVCDLGEDWVVFRNYTDNPGMGLWKMSYVMDDDNCCQLAGEPVCVEVQTTYVVKEMPAADSMAAITPAAVSTPVVMGRSRRSVEIELIELGLL